ncbi:MAG: hypothetical protein IPL27_21165 [Lewinellaceae bacterium]|nr:hypothetical protein [Lewinellaceae bacterium]
MPTQSSTFKKYKLPASLSLTGIAIGLYINLATDDKPEWWVYPVLGLLVLVGFLGGFVQFKRDEAEKAQAAKQVDNIEDPRLKTSPKSSHSSKTSKSCPTKKSMSPTSQTSNPISQAEKQNYISSTRAGKTQKPTSPNSSPPAARAKPCSSPTGSTTICRVARRRVPMRFTRGHFTVRAATRGGRVRPTCF